MGDVHLMNSTKKKFLFIFLLFSCVLGLLPEQFMLVADLVIIYSILKTWNVRGMFKTSMYLFVIFLLCSAISCYFYEKQSFWLTFTNLDFIMFFSFLSYFFMIKKRKTAFTVSDIEWCITRLYFIIFLVFLIQYALLPHRILHLATFIEGEKRFTVFGQIVTLAAYFYFLNKYIISKKNKYLLYLLPELLIVFMQGFRSYIVAIILVSALFVVKVGGIKRTMSIILITPILAFFIIQIPIVNNAVSNMMDRQVDANFSNEDYIRLRQFEYFTTEHFKSPVEYVFGSGFSNPRSEYGKRMFYLQGMVDENQTGPIGGWRDWGMVGLSWIIGLPCLLCILFCIFRIFRTNIPKQYLYLKYFYVFILLTSVTSVEFYRWGSVFFHGVLFYQFEMIVRKQKSDLLALKGQQV